MEIVIFSKIFSYFTAKKFSFNPNTKSKWIMERIDFKKFIIMTVLFVLSSVQVVDRVRHYISAPILSETMVIKEADFTLPAITICNSIVWHTKDSDYLDYYEIDKFWSMDPDRLSTISSVVTYCISIITIMHINPKQQFHYF